MTPQDWCDSMEPAFRDAWDMLGITYTDFVRTTEPRHAVTVQKFWQDLYDKGWCYKGSYEAGTACTRKPTTPRATSEKNDEGELVCPDCKRPVQKAGGEENWFFKLSEFGDKLLAFYDIDRRPRAISRHSRSSTLRPAAALTEDDRRAAGPHLRGHCAAVQKAGRRRERLPRCDQCRRGRRPER